MFVVGEPWQTELELELCTPSRGMHSAAFLPPFDHLDASAPRLDIKNIKQKPW
jgi:hypothetical protein